MKLGNSVEHFMLTVYDIYLTINDQEYLLIPMTRDKNILKEQMGRLIKADEHCFYPITEDIMEQLALGKTFKLKAQKNNNKQVRIKPLIGNISIPKQWQVTFNLLNHPEQKEQLLHEYVESKMSTKIKKNINSLFGKK